MNKTVVALAVVIAVILLVGFYIWSSHNRYYIMTGSEGVAYEVDRKTGESWMLYGGRKIPQEGPSSKRHQEPLPHAEASKVTGNAALSFGSFSGKIYNGSSWTVTRIVINVTAKEADDTVRWSRDFSENVTVSPLSTESFYVSVTGAHDIKDAFWTIKQVFGYKD